MHVAFGYEFAPPPRIPQRLQPGFVHGRDKFHVVAADHFIHRLIAEQLRIGFIGIDRLVVLHDKYALRGAFNQPTKAVIIQFAAPAGLRERPGGGFSARDGPAVPLAQLLFQRGDCCVRRIQLGQQLCFCLILSHGRPDTLR